MRWSLLELAKRPEIVVWRDENAYLLSDLGEDFSPAEVLHPSARLLDCWQQDSCWSNPVDLREARYLPPILGRKILCAGLNYRDHIEETKSKAPAFPNLFIRYPDSLVGHEQAIEIPALSSQRLLCRTVFAELASHAINRGAGCIQKGYLMFLAPMEQRLAVGKVVFHNVAAIAGHGVGTCPLMENSVNFPEAPSEKCWQKTLRLKIIPNVQIGQIAKLVWPL